MMLGRSLGGNWRLRTVNTKVTHPQKSDRKETSILVMPNPPNFHITKTKPSFPIQLTISKPKSERIRSYHGYSFWSTAHTDSLHLQTSEDYHLNIPPELIQLIISYIENTKANLNSNDSPHPNHNSLLKRLPKTDIFQYTSPYAPSHLKFWIQFFTKLSFFILYVSIPYILLWTNSFSKEKYEEMVKSSRNAPYFLSFRI